MAPAIILDVDGTLVDSNDAHAAAWVDAFSEAGVTVDPERVRRAIGMGGDKLMPFVSGFSESSSTGTRVSERRAEIFKERYLPSLRGFPRVRDLVRRFLDDGFRLAVASSAKEEELAPLLERANVADLIRTRTSSDDAEKSKPDPDIVEAAIARVGSPRNRIVMLGDTPYDVEAARRAGIAVVALESGGWSRHDLRDADAVFLDAADLLDGYERSMFAKRRREAPARA